MTIAFARRSEDSGDKDPGRRAEQNASIFQQENHQVFRPSKIIHRNTRGEEIEDGGFFLKSKAEVGKRKAEVFPFGLFV